MSDLVGNPEDRFSRVAAQFFVILMFMYHLMVNYNLIVRCFGSIKTIELCRIV